MEEITLQVGEETMVVLPGLGTAGYRWSAAVDDTAIVTVEALKTAPPSSMGRIGSWEEQFVMRALSVGMTIVRFRQGRSFEPDKPPRSTRDIQVHVSSRLLET